MWLSALLALLLLLSNSLSLILGALWGHKRLKVKQTQRGVWGKNAGEGSQGDENELQTPFFMIFRGMFHGRRSVVCNVGDGSLLNLPTQRQGYVCVWGGVAGMLSKLGERLIAQHFAYETWNVSVKTGRSPAVSLASVSSEWAHHLTILPLHSHHFLSLCICIPLQLESDWTSHIHVTDILYPLFVLMCRLPLRICHHLETKTL